MQECMLPPVYCVALSHQLGIGDTKGVTGKKGVPALDSDVGVCPVSPVVVAVCRCDSEASGSGNRSLNEV